MRAGDSLVEETAVRGLGPSCYSTGDRSRSCDAKLWVEAILSAGESKDFYFQVGFVCEELIPLSDLCRPYGAWIYSKPAQVTLTGAPRPTETAPTTPTETTPTDTAPTETTPTTTTETTPTETTPKPSPECRGATKGRGYDSLSAKMKQALDALYRILAAQKACVRFTSGFRAPEEQAKLHRDWHDIADWAGSCQEAGEQLKKAGFAQIPRGCKEQREIVYQGRLERDAKGRALGGPPCAKSPCGPQYERWHAIADRARDCSAAGEQLAKAKLAPLPRGCKKATVVKYAGRIEYEKDGLALGGPACPTCSRHVFAEGADLTVSFLTEDGSAYRPDAGKLAAAVSQVPDLCYPAPKADAVHVELKYVKKGKGKVPACHAFGPQ